MSDVPAWFAIIDDAEAGPFAPAVLKGMARSGRIGPETQVKREGMPRYVPASAVKGLLPVMPMAAAKPIDDSKQSAPPEVQPPTPIDARSVEPQAEPYLRHVSDTWNGDGTAVQRVLRILNYTVTRFLLFVARSSRDHIRSTYKRGFYATIFQTPLTGVKAVIFGLGFASMIFGFALFMSSKGSENKSGVKKVIIEAICADVEENQSSYSAQLNAEWITWYDKWENITPSQKASDNSIIANEYVIEGSARGKNNAFGTHQEAVVNVTYTWDPATSTLHFKNLSAFGAENRKSYW